MKQRIMKWITFSLVLALSLSLAACSGGASSSGASSAPASAGGSTAASEAGGDVVTVTWYESTDNQAMADAVAEAFNASRSDIQCEVVYIPQDSYDDKMKSLLAGGGSEVDVFHAGNVAPTNLYGSNGAVLDLAPYIATTDLDMSKLGGKERFVTTEDGKTWGMPDGWGGWFLFYNKDIFDAAGEPYPEQLTWDEYVELAEKLTDHANGQWGGYQPNWIFNLYALQKGNYLDAEDITPLAESLQLMKRMYDNSHMDIAEMQATGADPISMFASGNVAMMINGEWSFSQLRAEKDNNAMDVNWGATYLPVPEGVAPKTGVGGVSFQAISAGSEHPDEAWEFMEFLIGPEGAACYANAGNLPAYVTDEVSEGYLNFHENMEAAHLPWDPELVTNSEQGTHPRYSELVSLLKQHAELYLLGETTIDEFTEDFLADREAILG